MIVYLSGPITGHTDYKAAFAAAAARIRARGDTPCNPARLPEGLAGPREYILPCLQLLAGCEAIYMLPGWEASGGAKIERALAEYLGIPEWRDGHG